MTPGDAVRKKAEAWYGEPCGHMPPQSTGQLHGICIFCWRDRGGRAFTAGHAEGRAEGLEWAVSKYCRNKHDAECYNHETCPCERCCHYRPIHRELARSRGAAEGK